MSCPDSGGIKVYCMKRLWHFNSEKMGFNR